MKVNVDGRLGPVSDAGERFALTAVFRDLAAAINRLFTAFTVDNTNVTGTGSFLLTGSGALGYGAGSGDAVTQLTSKATTVTLNKTNGRIVMDAATLNAGVVVSFTLANNKITATDLPLVVFANVTGNPLNYNVWASASSGAASIYVLNRSAGNLSEAIVLTFAVIKAATS